MLQSFNDIENTFHPSNANNNIPCRDARRASRNVKTNPPCREARRASQYNDDGDSSLTSNGDASITSNGDASLASLLCCDESELYRGKYRIKSARAEWWNYSNDGIYFITICSAHHKMLFGKIVNGIMNLSNIGRLVECELNKSFEIRKELINHGSVIMPNHLHILIEINNPCPISNTQYKRSPKSISSFVAGFKASVTRQIGFDKSIWQARFHDRIVRNAHEYYLILDYIQKNPEVWHQDKFYTE